MMQIISIYDISTKWPSFVVSVMPYLSVMPESGQSSLTKGNIEKYRIQNTVSKSLSTLLTKIYILF